VLVYEGFEARAVTRSSRRGRRTLVVEHDGWTFVGSHAKRQPAKVALPWSSAPSQPMDQRQGAAYLILCGPLRWKQLDRLGGSSIGEAHQVIVGLADLSEERRLATAPQ
jgi:hypothetical protein